MLRNPKETSLPAAMRVRGFVRIRLRRTYLFAFLAGAVGIVCSTAAQLDVPGTGQLAAKEIGRKHGPDAV